MNGTPDRGFVSIEARRHDKAHGERRTGRAAARGKRDSGSSYRRLPAGKRKESAPSAVVRTTAKRSKYPCALSCRKASKPDDLRQLKRKIRGKQTSKALEKIDAINALLATMFYELTEEKNEH